jgi:hypothetical protein
MPTGPRPDPLDRWLAPAAIVLLASPCLFLSYLPMTDLPQHAAVASMLEHLGDPAWGFDPWYERAVGRTLYWLGYGVSVGLSQVVGAEFALRVVAFLSAIAAPLGAYAVLRATGRPGRLALLTLPLVYHRSFFWGFVNFNLSIGLALLAIAMLESDATASRRKNGALFALSCLIATTHVYGIAIVAGYLAIRFVAVDGWPLLRRLAPVSPLAVGAAIWLLMGVDSDLEGPLWFAPLADRIWELPDAIIGAYWNAWDEVLLISTLVVSGVFAARSAPVTPARWRAAGRWDRICTAYVAINLLLYFAMPGHTPAAHFIHFRHALLAAVLLPLLAHPLQGERSRMLEAWLLGGLAALSFAVHVPQLVRFDREARGFDRVVAQLPDAPRVYFLGWKIEGRVVKTHAYHHFHAYIQARRGGLISFGFPEMFWNIPVRQRRDAGIPVLPAGAEWNPWSYDEEDFGYFYDYVLMRGRGHVRSSDFPFEVIYRDPPWRLFRRLPPKDPRSAAREGAQPPAGATPSKSPPAFDSVD